MQKIAILYTVLFSVLCPPELLHAKEGVPKKDLSYYKYRASEQGEKKSTSAFLLDVAKTSAEGAVFGATCGFIGGSFAIGLGISLPNRVKGEFMQETMRKALLKAAVLHGTIYSVGSALLAIHKQIRSSSSEWLAQINTLDEDQFTKEPILVGKQSYLVSRTFSNIENSHSGNHYEFYVMPTDAKLADVFHQVIGALYTDETIKQHVAFVLIRVVPDTMFFREKPLPRIIVGLNDGVSKENAKNVLDVIAKATQYNFGLGKHPRYSKSYGHATRPLLYTAFGSGDYKEIRPDEFERHTGLLWNAPDDMAYKDDETQALGPIEASWESHGQ